MKRKFYDVLLDWKAKRADKYAVLIDGARRVGKSWIAEEFGRHEYEKCLLIDFSKASPALKRIFVENLHDLDTFFLVHIWARS